MKQKLLNFLEKNPNSSYSVEELSKHLAMNSSKNFVKLVKLIAKLEEQNLIELDQEGKVCLPKPLVGIEGVLRANERGFGFVVVEDMDSDIFISANNINSALDGDKVLVDVLKPTNVLKEQLAEGKIIRIVERKYKVITATVEKLLNDKYVAIAKPTNKKIAKYPVYISNLGLIPKKDEVVQVEITNYPSKKHNNLTGIVTSVLGHKDDPGVDILTIVEDYDIPTSFPDEVEREANSIPEEIEEIEAGRKDLTKRQIITIDGETAKDLDDAVEVKKLDNGNYYLGVHIADVSYYVKDHSELDKEAFKRGTSVYLTDRVIPMLPRRLSNGICSLNPNVLRYTLSCEMEINSLGEVVNYDIFPSVIKSQARMTYTDVNKIIVDKDKEKRQEYANLVSMFEKMADLHKILSSMREKRGAINFEDQEAVIKVDENGKPYDIEVRVRDVAEKMIESFMLIANETVARHFQKANLPFIYRVHEKPREDKIQAFFELSLALGLSIKGSKEDFSSKELQQILNQVAGKPEEAMVNTVLLRSMQQARYTDEPLGHYGLAANDYTHFTSPIRRYPDLIVHRLIREEYSNKLTAKRQESWQKRLPEIAENSSKMERRAVDAERETDAMKKAEYMESHIGEVFEGVISSITKFGIFIALPNTIEGLVHLSQLTDDYYEFYEKHMMLIGKRTGKIFKLGEKVRVKVIRADASTREIDFELQIPNNSKDTSQLKIKKREKKKQSKKQPKRQPFYQNISKKKRRRRKK